MIRHSFCWLGDKKIFKQAVKKGFGDVDRGWGVGLEKYFKRKKGARFKNEKSLKSFNCFDKYLPTLCSTVWGNTTKGNIKKLQSIQNLAVRIITGIKKYDHVTPALKQLNWLPVSE